MLEVSSCPDRQKLARLLDPQTKEGDASLLEEHVLTCDRCCDALENMESADTLVEAARGTTAKLPADEDVRQAIARLKAVALPRPAIDETLASKCDATDDAWGLESLLDPPKAEGELGWFAGYRVLRVLGAGGMGLVFDAEDPHLQRHVALKIMKPGLAAQAEQRKRFLREARAAAAIEHAHIVPVYQVGEYRNVPFLAMQLLKGESLHDRLERAREDDKAEGRRQKAEAEDANPKSKIENPKSPLPLAELLRIGREIAEALAVAHERKLIHRDIKPANVWLESPGGWVKLLDFGLAHVAEDVHLTQTGAILGTPAYMAPEQARGEALDSRSDLYSLGVVLYKLTTGDVPFRGASTMAVLMALATETPRPPAEINPEVPPPLNDLILRLLAKKLDERYESAAAVAEAIQAIEQAMVAPTLRGGEAVAEGDRLAPPSRSAGSIVRRPRWPGLVAAAAAAFLLAAIVIVVRDKEGREVARVTVPEGGSFDSELSPPAAKPNRSVSEAATKPAAKQNTAPASTDHAQRPKDAEGPVVVVGPDGTRPPRFAGNPLDRPADSPPPAIAPFDEAKAKNHQRQWAEYLKLPLEYTNSVGMKFVLIPPGEFIMGSTPEEIDEALAQHDPIEFFRERIKSEAPQHKVVLTRPFYLAVHEVTQKQYETVMGANPSYFAKTGAEPEFSEKVAELDTANHPVEGATWSDAADFCVKLSSQAQLKPFYFRAGKTVTLLKGNGYRLPTEAEWEFACRAGTTTKFFNGDDLPAGWYGENADGRTHEVGELAENPFGLFDVHGNVWEWVEDGWDPAWYQKFADKAAIDPRRPLSGTTWRVTRGGTWHYRASDCRSSARDPADLASCTGNIGFRVVLVPAGVRVGGLSPDAAKGSSSRRPDAEKPFVLVHADRNETNQFKRFAEAVALLREGDAIEIHGNGPFNVPAVRLEKGLIVRAAPGYRPILVASGSIPPFGAWFQVNGPLLLDGCDFVAKGQFHAFAGGGAPWEWRNCRFLTHWTTARFSGPQVQISDSLIWSRDAGIDLEKDVELKLTNNVIHTLAWASIRCFPGGAQKISLSRNTFLASTGGWNGTAAIALSGDANGAPQSVVIEAEGNLFDLRLAHALLGGDLELDAFRSNIRWQGRQNLYCGPDAPVLSGKDNVKVEGLDRWKDFWKSDETGSLSSPNVAFAWDSARVLPVPAAMSWLRETIERAKHNEAKSLPELGPDWDLIGPGEAYVRALAARGQEVRAEDLRPEPDDEGPFVLLRDGTVIGAHATLQEAIIAAKSGDTIEIRTDGPFVGASVGQGGHGRKLVIRSAPGYLPVLEGELKYPYSGDLTLEGIHFSTGGVHPDFRAGEALHLIHCSFAPSADWNRLSMSALAGKQSSPEIVNSWLPGVASLDLDPDASIAIRNSVVGKIISSKRGGRLTIERSLVWGPGCGWISREAHPECALDGNGIISLNNTLVESARFYLWSHALNQGDMADGPGWQNSRNLYRTGIGNFVERLRADCHSGDEGSLAAPPFDFDALQWRLLSGSPGYQAGPDGKDFGADVTRIATVAPRGD